MELTSVWDITFKQSDKVNHEKVTFIKRYDLICDIILGKNR